jgi:hypothetical protein
MTVRAVDARSARSYSFKLGDGKTTTVQQYFKDTHNINLQHPDWPCIMISKTAAIPLELCR